MKNTFNAVYQYAVVRFMPFIETREFANVGVVLIAPKTGKFLFKLAPKRFGRVTQFFDDLDGQLYKNAIDTFNAELERIQCHCINNGIRGREIVDYFAELTRHRESVLHFGSVGRMMGDTDSVELEKLYQRFVARDFVNEQYREQQMVRVLKKTFAANLTEKYTEKKLKAGILEVPMPLVHKGINGYKVIKPLAFEQNTPLKAYEHGVHWMKRVDILIQKRVISKERALFTVERPTNEKTDLIQIFDDIVGEIKELGVQVERFDDTNKIIHFAKADEVIPNENSLTH